AAGTLERNTAYAYVLLCDHFRATNVIAELEGEPVGFVAAYRPPTHHDTVFVWQVGVLDAARGLGVAGTLLDALVARPGCRGVRYLEATVTPSNEASRRLFESFARRRGADVAWSDGYPATLFAPDHEPEHLVRIGPFGATGESVS
ncbi:MAG: diaminobutyrate acetyltransferase, partial [Sandaracinaceae bacterium]|nr:diaminobutyrate acetyltransferase [Sandaracinaceae bacterium]